MKIGVIGAGTMGRGVSELFASNAYKVVLIDCSSEALKAAEKEILNITRFRWFQNRDINVSELQKKILDNISFSTDMELLSEVDFVVENTNEVYEVKEPIFKNMDKICKSDTIFAANTSCLSITKLAQLTDRQDKVIGIHFMNPVAYIDAAEVIMGVHTSDTTLQTAKGILTSVNKETIVIKDAPGFVSNRISHLMMNEAAFIVQEGVASPEAIDDIFKKCYGHKMGPLETADLIGIDTVTDSLDVLFDSYKDSKFRCCTLMRKMVDAGLKGRKTGEGFYKY